VPQTTGYIAIADISGYTTFVADTEIEHSREILAELLEVTSRELERHLRLSRVQGDALVCVGEEDEVIPASRTPSSRSTGACARWSRRPRARATHVAAYRTSR
jgi:hypothetical protein